MPKPNPFISQKIMADFMATMKMMAGEVKRHYGNLKQLKKSTDDTEELAERLMERDKRMKKMFNK